ncbi:MAG: NifB/NifX family molybdenum-iron cluster-binding protein [Bacillota bacterium]
MKLAICAEEEGLEARVDRRFGRCACFVIVDMASGEEVESLRNDSAGASGGAGAQSAQLLSQRNVEAVVLGNVGPNAVVALKAAGIDIYTGLEGTVRETLQKFREGKLHSAAEATVSSHFGMKKTD